MVGFFITTRGYRWGTMRLFECIKREKGNNTYDIRFIDYRLFDFYDDRMETLSNLYYILIS